MARRSKILIAAVLAALALAVGAGYAFDGSRRGEIADGITIDGVDVGGMDTHEAEAAVRRRLLGPLRRPLMVTYRDESWVLPAGQLKLRGDVSRSVKRALSASQDGSLPARLVREVTGGEVRRSIVGQVEYSHSAINRFVRRIAADINREPRDASVEPTADSLRVVGGKAGRKLRDNALTRDLEVAVTQPGRGAIIAKVHAIEPQVTRSEVASRHPSYLTLDRATFTLRLWRNLKLADTYTVAVGRQGLETPEGLYDIQVMEEDPVWRVPRSAWAGDLAGKTIPPGPENPIKARWMGIYEGAGIHGTEDVESLGSAASHGCVRMSIADVKALYDEVEVGTPIYIG